MPKCQNCGESVSSEDLRVIEDNVVCVECGGPKDVGSSIADKRQVAAITLNEVPAPNNVVDYEIAVEGGYAGLEIRFHTTFDKVRSFFTQQRSKKKRPLLQSIE